MSRLLDTNVRYFDNTVTVAQLKNEWGSMVKVLDEVLVNGGEVKNVLTVQTISDPKDDKYWLSTIVLDKPHKYMSDLSVVAITGSSEPLYNSVFRVQEVKDTSFTIAFDKAKVSSPPLDILDATGITVKLAPLGFTKVYYDFGKAVYKSSNPNANICYLRVDDTVPVGYDVNWAKFARVSMYSDLKHIDEFQPRIGRLKAPYYTEDPVRAEVPVGTGVSGKFGESKWYYATSDGGSGWFYEQYAPPAAGPYGFSVIGDNKTFYITPSLIGYRYWDQRVGYCFGEYVDTLKDNNINNHILCAHEVYLPPNQNWGHYSYNPGGLEERNTFSRTNTSWGKYLLNDEQASDLLQNHIKADFISMNGMSLSGRDTSFSFNQYTLSLNIFKVYLKGLYPNKAVLKGFMRGYYFIGNNLQEYRGRYPKFREVINNIKNYPNKKFVLLTIFQNLDSGGEWNGFQNSRIAFELNNWE